MNASACIAALRSVRRAIEELAYLPRKLAVAAAPMISGELRNQFVRGVDAYGNPWAPLKPSTLRKHGPPPLTDTRRLRDGTRAYARTGGRAGIVVEIGAPYGAFHQLGFRVGRTKVPARRILPNRGLPAKWREILDRNARFIAERARGAI
jgi:phage gpG-like protein